MKLKFTFLALLITFAAMGQQYPVKTIDGAEYYVYVVQKGEGLYAISKKFNVLQSEIFNANPGVENGLQLGQTLYIPKKTDANNEQETKEQMIRHVVLLKQTLFSIGKMYGVGSDDILKANPQIEGDKIQVGQILNIPVSNKQSVLANQTRVIDKIKDRGTAMLVSANVQKQQPEKVVPEKKKFVAYEVKKRKESLYSISKQFNVSINELLEANPFAENGIKKGDILQIPVIEENIPKPVENKSVNDTVKHAVQPKETLYSISKMYKVTQEELQNANLQLKSGLKVGDTLIIPVVEALPNIPAVAEQPPTPSFEANGQLKVAYLLPFYADNNTNTERFVDFYRGSLLALDEIKKNGISVEVFAYDTKLGTAEMPKVLTELKQANVDMIIGPAYPEQIGAVSAFAKKNKAIQVVPFSSKVQKSEQFDNLYQFNPAYEDIYGGISRKILENYADYDIIFVKFSNQDGKKYAFADLFKKFLKTNSIDYQEINASTYNKNETGEKLKKTKCLMVLSACNQQEFSDFVATFKDLNPKNCVFLGDEDLAQNKIKGKYSAAYNVVFRNFIYYSLFNTKPADDYIDNYKKYFGNRQNNASIPNYDLIGYDLTLYFCRAYGQNRTLMFNSSDIELMQSKFNFVKQNGGNVNTAFFLNNLQYDNLIIVSSDNE
jgi:LysM repeat protein